MKLVRVTTPVLENHAPRGLFRARNVVIAHLEGGGSLRVPAGFWFDGASIPATVYPLLLSAANQPRAALFGQLHDYAYRRGALRRAPDGHERPISRLWADRLAQAAADWAGISAEDALEIYLGLRLGAAKSFRKKPVDWHP